VDKGDAEINVIAGNDEIVADHRQIDHANAR
jgi:hypothetical protein